MEPNILQTFLDRGLLDVGEDTDKFVLLTSAAGDLAQTLKADRRTLVRSASVLLGGHLSEQEPILQLCEEAIRKQWPTYRSRFQTDTRQLFRAALLQAVSSVTQDSDGSYAATVLYSASSGLPYLVSEREDDIFRTLLLGLAARVEKEAHLSWARADSLVEAFKPIDGPLPTTAIALKALSDALKGGLGAATGVPGANAQWPGTNTQEYLDHFGKMASEGIAAAITAALKDAAPKLLARVAENDASVLSAAKQAAANERRRADLIYWKESLFSPGTQTSYRKLPADCAACWVAYDLHLQVPPLHPISVEYFLRETLRSAVGDKVAAKPRTVDEFLSGLPTDNLSPPKASAPLQAGRLTLLEGLEGSLGGLVRFEDVAGRLGVVPDLQVPREELSVWLFRDLQARRLADGS